MMNTHSTLRRGAVATVAALSLVALAGCSSGGGEDSSDGQVELTWWHNGTGEPLLSIWQDAADAYMEENPNVSIEVLAVQEEDLRTRLPLALGSNDPPDIYPNQGGGLLQTQVQSGQVADITEFTDEWIDDVGPAAGNWKIDGVQYGVPHTSQVVGFWYRTDLFEEAGITETPETMDDLYSAIDALKAIDVAPISVGGQDRWPTAFYYNTFAVRQCDPEVLVEQLAAAQLEDECFTEAGENLLEFLESEPFNEGYNGTPAQTGAGSSAGLLANGQSAMELQGTWDFSVVSDLSEDPDIKQKLGWFPFPAVDGGAGDPTASLGGGDGFSCTQANPEVCADFLRYLTSDEVQTQLVEGGVSLIPVSDVAAESISEPIVQEIYAFNSEAAYVQTYFDVALPTAVGQALNDAVANLFAGQGEPSSIVDAVNAG